MASLMIEKDLYALMGGMDDNLFFYHEDCDFGYKLKNHGYKYKVASKTKIIHIGGTSSFFNAFAYKEYFKGLLYVYKKISLTLHIFH